MNPRVASGIGLVVLLLTACQEKTGPAALPHVKGTPKTDDVVDAWDDAGLKPDPFEAVEPGPYRAGYCAQGQVKQVEALICEYRDDESLDRARKGFQEGWAKKGIHTGATVRTGRTLVVVSDPKKADPNGKTIHALLMAVKKLNP